MMDNDKINKELADIVANYDMGFLTCVECLLQIMDVYQNTCNERAMFFVNERVSERLKDAVEKVIEDLAPFARDDNKR